VDVTNRHHKKQVEHIITTLRVKLNILLQHQ